MTAEEYQRSYQLSRYGLNPKDVERLRIEYDVHVRFFRTIKGATAEIRGFYTEDGERKEFCFSADGRIGLTDVLKEVERIKGELK